MLHRIDHTTADSVATPSQPLGDARDEDSPEHLDVQADSESRSTSSTAHRKRHHAVSPRANTSPLNLGWGSDLIGVCIVILTMLALLYTAYLAAPVVFPIVLAVLIGLPFRAPVRWMRRIGIPEFLGACIIITLVGSLLVGGAYMIAGPARKWIKEAPQNLARVEEKLMHFGESTIAEVKDASKKVEEIAEEAVDDSAVEVQIKQPSWTSKALNATTSMLVGAIICISLVFLLLAFGEEFFGSIVHVFPRGYDRRKADHLIRCLERVVSNYLFSYGAINIGLGIVIGLGLWLMGMPNPGLWGVMAACLNFIPLAGLIAGTAIVTLVAILSFDSIGYSMIAPAIYLTANGLECNIITPAILGRSLRLSVVVILISVVLWGWIWGIGGAVIAVPLLATLKIICDHFETLKPISIVLSGRRKEAVESPCEVATASAA